MGLDHFSYEELNAVEAGELKKSFNTFKIGLEDKVFGVPPVAQLNDLCASAGIALQESETKQKQTKAFAVGYEVVVALHKLILQLENTPLSENQVDLVLKIKNLDFESREIDLPSKGKTFERHFKSTPKTRIDLVPLWEECMEQFDLLEELVRLFKQNILEFVGKTTVYLKNENVSGIDFACQKIGQSLRMMHSHTLLEMTEQMSKVCKTDNDIKYLNFLYQEFLQEYPKVEEELMQQMQLRGMN
ncbi:MAG: hypothetical protein AAF554_10525 [Bacteroidota bacterium]